MRSKIYIFILLLICNTSIAQNRRVDSLLNVIRSSNDSASSIQSYLVLTILLENLNKHEKAIQYAKRGMELATNLKDTSNILNFYMRLNDSYKSIGNSSLAIKNLYDGLYMCENKKDSANLQRFYKAIGTHFWNENNSKKALEYYNLGLKICERQKIETDIPGFYNNIGLAHKALGDLEMATFYYKKGVDLALSLGQTSVAMQIFNNLAGAYFNDSSYDNALFYYKKSLDLAKKLNNEYHEALVLGNLGEIYLTTKKYKESEINLLESIRITIKIDDKEGQIYNYETLTKLYEAINDPKKALFYYKEYLRVYEVLQKEISQNDLQREEIKHEYEKELLNIEQAQSIKDEKTKADKQKSKYITYSITIGLLVLLVFFIVLFNRFKITKSQNIIIASQKKVVEEKQKEVLDSIHYAKRIQDSLFEEFDPGNKFFSDSFILLQPKDIVSGDFYWHSKKMNTQKISSTEILVTEQFFIAACDSTGHGVPGGFMSLLSLAYISEAINEKNIFEPNKVLDHARERLINSMSKNGQKDGFDGVLLKFEKSSTFVNKEITKSEMKLDYAAAHNAPIIVRGGNVIELETDKMPVGYGERKDKFNLYTYHIETNDIVYVYTDGYADQFGGPKGKKLMYKKQTELIKSVSHLTLSEQKAELQKTFNEWKGDLEQVDDVLVVGIKI